jgi:tetratricopeptide (TPR) repeat protein
MLGQSAQRQFGQMRRFLGRVLLGLLIAGSAATFLPGIAGPFIFDDYSNLIHNSYVKITALDVESLRRAAYSLDAGPLQRPVAMATFALNHYWAGTFRNPVPYKLTNIAIHSINALLIWWLLGLIFGRLTEFRASTWSKLSAQTIYVLAGSAAILWTVHPIQVSTVLYVIQRMTQLSSLFTVLALIAYMIGRRAMLDTKRWGAWLTIAGPVVFGALGLLCKENAVLIPLLMVLLEFVLFPSEYPWSRWKNVDPSLRLLVFFALGFALVAGSIAAILYALPPYSGRTFSMVERLLTESRVLWFYLFLIFVPRTDKFGHQHDDIEISTSLFQPWTTVPSVVAHMAVIFLALLVRRQHPLLTFGILWFYVSHLLESTIIALEIAYEHRNYLALLGPVLILVELTESAHRKLAWRRRWLLVGIAGMFAALTLLRSTQWGNTNAFYRYEAEHHPRSPRVQLGLSILLEYQGRYEEAAAAIRRAIALQPEEVGNYLALHLTTARQNKLPTLEEQQKTVQLLRVEALSATAFLALQHTVTCLQTWCTTLQEPLEFWARTVIARGIGQRLADPSYWYYLLGVSFAAQGKTAEASRALWQAHESDPAYLHPLFVLASIYVQLDDLSNAERTLTALRRANLVTKHPRDRELAKFQEDVENMRAIHHGRARKPVAQ